MRLLHISDVSEKRRNIFNYIFHIKKQNDCYLCYTCAYKLEVKHGLQYKRRFQNRVGKANGRTICLWKENSNSPATSEDGFFLKKTLKSSEVEIPILRRKSNRMSESTLKQKKKDDLEQAIRSEKAEGLKIKDFGTKGRGIETIATFSKDEFVIEYIGTLLDLKTAKAKEGMYSHDPSKGCYSYYFNHGGRPWCIDATEDSKYMGRLLNHSRKTPNLVTKTVELDSKPHLVLLAKRDIKIGEELLYDYGDRSKESLEHHPWLAL